MNELTEKKTPEQLGAEIRMYTDAGRRISLLCGIEIGKRLTQAKELLEHGEWLPWLERETEFSDRSAQRYMKLFEEYGASQLGLFGPETNTPTLSDLPISKAFALLSVPESEREAFAETVDAEHLSVRELEQAIREKQEAEKQLEEARLQVRESEKLRQETAALQEELTGKLAEANRQIRELESRPVEVAVERDEKAIEEAAKAAKEKAEAAAKKKIEELEKKLNRAENERAAAKTEAETAGQGAAEREAAAKKEAEALRAELEEARKQLKASDADVTALGIRFNTMQNEYSYVIRELGNVLRRNPETGAKLTEAVRQLLGYFTQELEKLSGEGKHVQENGL